VRLGLARLKAEARDRLDQVDDRRREAWNAARFGRRAPRVRERLWIDPAQVHAATLWFPAKSGQVVRHWPPAAVVPFDDHPHVAYALAHWRDGVPWEDTGAFEYMLRQIDRRGSQDGCHDADDVRARFARLDDLYSTVGQEGRLRPRHELDRGAFREAGGILAHVDRAARCWRGMAASTG
jgi:hypothetical protein